MKQSLIKKRYFNFVSFTNIFNLYKLHFFNLISFFKVGDVIYIKYLDNSNFLNTRFFIGLCFFFNKSIRNSSFGLRNNLNKDFLEFIFFLYSPFILELRCLRKYSKKFRLSKLYFLRSNFLNLYL